VLWLPSSPHPPLPRPASALPRSPGQPPKPAAWESGRVARPSVQPHHRGVPGLPGRAGRVDPPL